MARIRTIKPEFWTDEKLAECSLPARLLFIGIWNFADDEGRMEYSAKRLKMQVFPGDNIEVAPLVEELANRSLVTVYRAGNREFLAVPNFKKHQRIDHPRASAIPAPLLEGSANILRSLKEASAKDPRMLAPEGNGMEGNGMEESKAEPPPSVTQGHAELCEAQEAGRDDAAPPEGLHPIHYAARLLGDLAMTNTRSNLCAVKAAVELEIRQGKSGAAAYEFILARARGRAIDQFYFVDWGKHRNGPPAISREVAAD